MPPQSFCISGASTAHFINVTIKESRWGLDDDVSGSGGGVLSAHEEYLSDI